MNNQLGDLFPLELREQLAKQNLKVGSVFKFFDKIANKEKIVILLGFKYDRVMLAFVRINSQINSNIFPTEALRNEHYEMEYDVAIRPFLSHTSFVNCSIFVEKEYLSMFNELVNDPALHLGELCDEDLTGIRIKIAKSKLLPTNKKKEFGLFYPPKNK